MAEYTNPFETLATEVQSRRRERSEAEQQIAAGRHKIAQLWQTQIRDLLRDAGSTMANIQIEFGQTELLTFKNELMGLQFPIYGLPKSAKLYIQVDKPHFAQVWIAPEQAMQTVRIAEEFPAIEFSAAVAAVLRAALL